MTPEAKAREMCANCDGEQWVCEDHPEVPWRGGDGCCGGAGMPCKCSPMYQLDMQRLKQPLQAERDKVDRLKAALEFYAEGDLVGDLEIRPEKKEFWSIPEQWERRSMSDHWSGKRARAALSAFRKAKGE